MLPAARCWALLSLHQGGGRSPKAPATTGTQSFLSAQLVEAGCVSDLMGPDPLDGDVSQPQAQQSPLRVSHTHGQALPQQPRLCDPPTLPRKGLAISSQLGTGLGGHLSSIAPGGHLSCPSSHSADASPPSTDTRASVPSRAGFLGVQPATGPPATSPS